MIGLNVSSKNLADTSVQKIARELAISIESHAGIPAEIKQNKVVEGQRGDPITIGAIVIGFFSSGAAVALAEVLKSYFSRDSSLEFEFEKVDGSRVSLSAKNMANKDVDEIVAKLASLLRPEAS